MSEIIPLEPIPNQNLTVVLETVRYELTLKEAGGMMVISISRAGEKLLDSLRCVAGTPLLPYPYLERGGGTFIFTTAEEGAIPYWIDFATTAQLIYITAVELALLRAEPRRLPPPTPPFEPPLRYSFFYNGAGRYDGRNSYNGIFYG